ncbi:uncharacterized protein LOC112594049 isoform X2 [Melanaphis sacchari]|uniref:uncharacterized protein LOC112594049 isoform X2 n=1 Tax=Melanaphis sacchari TaxID=742174 RepID=UPI000DC14F6D|nr:uncharacterized protein LOC112594049 isoform X2 [Melanaphis sacchari]
MAVNVDRTIEDMTAAGSFGQDSRIVSFKPEGLHTEQDNFASCVVYGVAIVDDHDGRRRSHRIVFKYKHAEFELRELCNNDNQFHNEMLFYERIAPFLLAHGSRRHDSGTDDTMLCRYIYGRNNCGDEWHRRDRLENATVNGYRKSVIGHKLSLDFDHLNVALRKLAKRTKVL